MIAAIIKHRLPSHLILYLWLCDQLQTVCVCFCIFLPFHFCFCFCTAFYFAIDYFIYLQRCPTGLHLSQQEKYKKLKLLKPALLPNRAARLGVVLSCSTEVGLGAIATTWPFSTIWTSRLGGWFDWNST